MDTPPIYVRLNCLLPPDDDDDRQGDEFDHEADEYPTTQQETKHGTENHKGI